MKGDNSQLYFGRTQIYLIEGNPLDHLLEGLYAGANSRGVMGAGFAADVRRAAGAEVERDLRAQSPLLIGEGYLTGPGRLAEQGVKAIAHGVAVAEPGDPRPLAVAIRAVLAGMNRLEEAGCRSITIPQVGWRVSGMNHSEIARELGRATITHLRRRSRIHTVNIVSQHQDYLQALRSTLEREINATSEGR